MEKLENGTTTNQQAKETMNTTGEHTFDQHNQRDENNHAGKPARENLKMDEPASSAAERSQAQRSFIQRYAFMFIIVLDRMSDGLGYSTLGQFRYSFFHAQYQDQLNPFNVTRGGDCDNDSLDPQVQAIENTISGETAKWGLYGDYVSMVPLIVSSLLVGMKSDRIGRRFLFLLPPIAGFINYGVKAAVVRSGIHYGWIFIGSFIAACFGNSIPMQFAAYSLISDTHGKKHETTDTATTTTTSDDNPTAREKNGRQAEKSKLQMDNDDADLDLSREKSRTVKIVAVDVLISLSYSLSAFVTGYIIQYAGFFYSFVIVASAKVSLLVVAYFFVTETGEQKKCSGVMEPLRTIWRTLKDPAKGSSLILLNLAICFALVGFVDEFDIIQTYEMSPPFCLNAVKLGWLTSENHLKGLFAMPLLWLWQRLRMSERTIATVGMVFYTVSSLVLASVQHMWVFFVVPVIAIPGTLSTSMAKVITSRLVGRSALASTFALTLTIEVVFWFGGSIAANYTYQHFLPILPTAPFYLASAAFAVATILFGIEAVKHHRSSSPMAADSEKAVHNS